MTHLLSQLWGKVLSPVNKDLSEHHLSFRRDLLSPSHSLPILKTVCWSDFTFLSWRLSVTRFWPTGLRFRTSSRRMYSYLMCMIKKLNTTLTHEKTFVYSQLEKNIIVSQTYSPLYYGWIFICMTLHFYKTTDQICTRIFAKWSIFSGEGL